MSAFIVGREHINYLIQAALSRVLNPCHSNLAWIWGINRETGNYHRSEIYTGDRGRASEVGQMLWDENIKSVHARYPSDTVDQLPGPIGENYVFEYRYNSNISIDPVQVLKACKCFEYQSCEHDDWEDSEAKAFIDALKEAAINVLPGYDDAKWEIHAA